MSVRDLSLDYSHRQLRPALCPVRWRLLLVWAGVLNWALAVGVAETQPAARLAVTTDQPGGVYELGQPIRWRIETEPNAEGLEMTYALKRGGLSTVLEGKLNLTNGVQEIESTITDPDVLLMEVKATGKDGKSTRALGGAVAAPDGIQPSLPCPADFDAFWQSKLDLLANTPADPQLTPADGGRSGVDYWRITMNNIRGTHIQGQLARPANGDKLPAMLIVQWAGVYPLQKAWATDPAAAGWLVLNINAHDLPIDESAEFYQHESQGPLKDYPAIANDDRDTSYFLRMYLSCYRAAQYLAERPDWDGRTLVVTGNSQGGMQALMTAGFHPRITCAIAGVPAGCDLTGPKAGRSPGWPAWYWKTQGKDAEKVITASRYYDVMNFASRIRCPVLVGVGLIDETCPPAGILATLNQVKGPKEIVFLPKGAHQDSNNSHGAFNERARIWRTALVEGKPAPVRKLVLTIRSALETDPTGWLDILPSADLAGWHRVSVPPGEKLGRDQWHVDAGRSLLVCDGDGGHDMLLFDKEIGDAIFHLEFCYTKIEGKSGYNSGVYVRNSPDGAIWHQAQIGDRSGGYLFGETPGADGKKKFFSLDKQVQDGRVKAAGEWNTMEITARGKTLTLWVNGAVTCKFDQCGQPRGQVGVEGEGYRIEFRNLKLKSLDP
jgi:cephalosporin-C deacetylase